MRRFDPEHPMRIAYVIGTFSAHPVVMGAMNEFLKWLVQPAARKLYAEAKHRCEQWVRSTNERLAELASAGSSYESSRPCGRCSLKNPAAITGCFSTTFAPKE